MLWREDREHMVGYYQHGPNPEAVLKTPLISFGTPEEAAANVREKYRTFAERIHRYEESGPTRQPEY